MDALSGRLAGQLQSLSVPELVAVVAAVLYLVLAIRQNIWCWFFAGLSTAIYVVLMFDAKLYMESALNVFYFLMAVYGCWFWLTHGPDASGPKVVRWPASVHGAALVVIVVVTAVAGFLLTSYTDAAFPYVDSMTTIAALWATFLVARKVLENWWYWLAIDSVSIYLYWVRDLQLTSVLFAAYVLMIPFGLAAWTRALREQAATSP